MGERDRLGLKKPHFPEVNSGRRKLAMREWNLAKSLAISVNNRGADLVRKVGGSRDQMLGSDLAVTLRTQADTRKAAVEAQSFWSDGTAPEKAKPTYKPLEQPDNSGRSGETSGFSLDAAVQKIAVILGISAVIIALGAWINNQQKEIKAASSAIPTPVAKKPKCVFASGNLANLQIREIMSLLPEPLNPDGSVNTATADWETSADYDIVYTADDSRQYNPYAKNPDIDPKILGSRPGAFICQIQVPKKTESKQGTYKHETVKIHGLKTKAVFVRPDSPVAGLL